MQHVVFIVFPKLHCNFESVWVSNPGGADFGGQASSTLQCLPVSIANSLTFELDGNSRLEKSTKT